MRRILYPYQGEKPFIFVICGPDKFGEARGTIRELFDRNYRVWYAAENQKLSYEAMEFRLNQSACVIVFFSRNLTESQTCRMLINHCNFLQKPTICVLPSDAKLSGGVALQLQTTPKIQRSDYHSVSDYIRGLCQKPGMTQELIGDGVEGYPKVVSSGKKQVWRKIGISIGVLFLSAAIFYFSGAYQKIKTVVISRFPDSQIVDTQISACVSGQRNPAYKIAFAEKGESAVTEVRIYGDYPGCNPEEIVRSATGKLYIGENEVGMGTISDLSGLENLTNLRSLSISFQLLHDASSLARIPSIESLDLSGNQIDRIGWISALSHLNSLDLSQNPLVDISPLHALPSLTRLNLSETSITSLENALPSTLEKLNISGCKALLSMEPLLKIPALQEVSISAEQWSIAENILPEASFILKLQEGYSHD